jgi:hypothetical protein
VINFGGKARFIGITTIAAAAAIAAGQAAPAFAAPATPASSAPALSSVVPLGQDGVISGTVDGPANIALAGVCVTASGPAGARAARTNARGRYVLAGVRAGAYSLTYTDCASPDSYLPARYPVPVMVTAVQPALLAPISLTPASPAQAIATENSYARSHPALRAAAASRPLVSGTVRSAAGKPLAGICVTALIGGTVTSPLGPEQFEGQWSVQTVADGRYSIPSFAVSKGETIRMQFTDGCGNTGNYAPQYWRNAAIRHAATVLREVTAGTTFSGIDARLTRGAAVSGVIRGGSATGPGLAGACVNASGHGDQSGIDLAATTGPGGRYKLVGLGTGPYQIWFATGCGVKGNYIGARYGRVHVRTGATTTGVNGFLPPGATFSGVVTSQAGGARVAGICVTLTGSTGSMLAATTGKSGTYSIDRVTEGSYFVYFSGGCGNTGSSYAPQFFDDQAAAGAAGTVHVSTGGTATANASLQPGGTLAGRVTNPAGKPLGNVCVSPVSQLQNDLGAGAAASFASEGSYNVLTTNRAGEYSDPNLAPGLYAVSFSPCSSDNSLGAAWFTGGGSAPQWLSVNAGVVTSASVVLPRSGAMSGTVTTASGRPVSGVCVLASPPAQAELDAQTSVIGYSVSGSGITGNSGRYKLTGLAPGTYTVSFAPCLTSRRYAPAWYKNKLAGQPPTPVTIRTGQTTGGIDAVLGAGKSASGVIRSGISHRPVAGACVIALPGKFSLLSAVTDPLSLEVAQTGKSGRFTLHNLAPGSYDLIADPCQGGSLALTASSVHVPAGSAAERTTTIILPRSGTISGVVSAPAADGGGAAACVIVEPISPHDVGPGAIADTDGRYTLTNLAPGRYRIEFTSDCSNGTSELAPVTVSSVTVTSGRNTTVNGTLPVVGDISGTVTAGGSPVPGECVAAFTSATASTPAATAITGTDGSYQIGFLAPGSYRVKFSTGCGDAGYATQWWHDVTAAGHATAVPVLAGEPTAGIDAALTSGG